MSIFGDIIKTGINIVALPIKVGEEVLGQAIGTNGKDLKNSVPVLSDITDKMKDIVDAVDE